MHVYWGAKEALYKAYGKGELDFKKNILVEPFLYENIPYHASDGEFQGTILKEDFKKNFNLFYRKIDNYILVYAIEKN